MQKRSIFAAIAAVAVTATAVYASVNYDPATGGWSGKGDVQTAFGWNNKLMQQNHLAITFEYEATFGYEFDCEWTTGPDHNRTHHQVTETVSFPVQGTVADADRKTGQWTGWHLAAIGDVGTDIPEPTDATCGGFGAGKTLVEGSVEPIVGDAGGLYAVFGADRRMLGQ